MTWNLFEAYSRSLANLRTVREWFVLMHDAAARLDHGLTASDLRDYFIEIGEPLGDEPITLENVDQFDELVDAFGRSAQWLKRAKLVEVTYVRPMHRKRPGSFITPLPEMTITFTEAGRNLRAAKEGKFIRRLGFVLALASMQTLAARLKAPLAIASGVFAILKFALQWNSNLAAIIAVTTAAAAAVAAAISSGQ